MGILKQVAAADVLRPCGVAAGLRVARVSTRFYPHSKTNAWAIRRQFLLENRSISEQVLEQVHA